MNYQDLMVLVAQHSWLDTGSTTQWWWTTKTSWYWQHSTHGWTLAPQHN